MSKLNEYADEDRKIKASDIDKLDFSDITLLDLREKDEYIISTLPGAANVTLGEIGAKINDFPKNKQILVFCREGDWSEEVLELLLDAGYDAYELAGGYNAYRNLKKPANNKEEKTVNEPKQNNYFLDAKGLKCPGPIVKTGDKIRSIENGDILTVEADEAAFYSDISVWCDRTGNTLQSISEDNGKITAVIKKGNSASNSNTSSQTGNDKTMVVFSGDLDKTIAAFIIANGALAMGRKVTIFFTFWGLNILRKSEKVKVKKSFIEKMFGLMMPRGTKKLGLSRMNMGGAGAKMIRAVMKSKGVNSLEELIAQAIEHGARIVACQMSMDIMGIKKEELIDGVELGGAATFLGSGEQSDMSLFI